MAGHPSSRRVQGAYRTLFYGAGIDFADLRAYVPEDDVRHIDWNVTARLDEPFVRQYTEDRELTAWLLLDRSSSMHFGPAGRGKDVVMIELATALARLLTRGGNRVGAILYDNRVEQTIPPRSGRDQVLRIAHELLRPPPASQKATDLTGLLHAARSTVRRRSLIVLISDFLSGPDWDEPLAALARKHEVVVLRLADPLEAELPDVGLLVVEDSETGEQLLVDTSDPAFRARLQIAANTRTASTASRARRAGADVHDVSTADDLGAALVRMIERRAKRLR
jgi:uncharacterized protein (DUF58 family)